MMGGRPGVYGTLVVLTTVGIGEDVTVSTVVVPPTVTVRTWLVTAGF